MQNHFRCGNEYLSIFTVLPCILDHEIVLKGISMLSFQSYTVSGNKCLNINQNYAMRRYGGSYPGLINWMPKFGNFWATYLSRETAIYSDYNQGHVFTFLEIPYNFFWGVIEANIGNFHCSIPDGLVWKGIVLLRIK